MSLVRSMCPEVVNTNLWYYIGKAHYFAQSLLHNEFTASKINERIYLGDLSSALNKEELKKQGITHILSIINGAYEKDPDDFKYKIIAINDDPWVNIAKYFPVTNEFIENALSENPNNKILIHCKKGVSRSVTVLMAYMLYSLYNKHDVQNKDGLSDANVEILVNEVLANIREAREIAKPNQGFIDILKKYVKEDLSKTKPKN